MVHIMYLKHLGLDMNLGLYINIDVDTKTDLFTHRLYWCFWLFNPTIKVSPLSWDAEWLRAGVMEGYIVMSTKG